MTERILFTAQVQDTANTNLTVLLANVNTQANASFNQANSAYAQANLAYTAANSAQTAANTANTQANLARDQANTAYGQANNAYAQANLAYTAANAAGNVQVFIGGAAIGNAITGNLNFVSANASNLSITGTLNSSPSNVTITFDTRVPAGGPGGASDGNTTTQANGTVVLANAPVNFNNTSSVIVTAAANGTTTANVAFSVNSNLTLTILNMSGGNINMANNYVVAPVLKQQQEVYSNTGLITAANVNIDVSKGSYIDIMLTINSNLTFQNVGATGNTTTFTMIVRQSANGSNTLSYANTIRWSDNTVPILTTTANTMDVLTFVTYNGGAFWLGSMVMANIPLANIY